LRAIVGLWRTSRAASLDGRITLSEAVMGSLDGTLRLMHKKAAVDVLYALCVRKMGSNLLVAGSIKSVALSECLPASRLTQERVLLIRLVASSGENMDIVGRKDRGVYRKFVLVKPGRLVW
jgi:hypothetical protein